ncbi:Uncharacterised protein [Serratia fonticola]|uniref:Uncharacterized protein n=1 Tax=Serratia fonticola TaxID=47917 RepID=A0A4V6KWM0_SERFO|nr:Uncharacterised protein [Serratia fonticola]
MNATVCTYKNNRNFWIFWRFLFPLLFHYGHLLSVSADLAV